MKISQKILLLCCATSVLVGLGLTAANAASLYRAVPIFVQEKSNWCWGAAAKSSINYHKGTNPSQCTVYKRGKGGTTCPNSTGTLGSVSNALLNSGFTSTGTYTSNTVPYSQLEGYINQARPFFIRWGWDSSGGIDGHVIVVRGYDTTGSKVSYVNPLLSTYQVQSYTWMVSGGGHTWSHTLHGIVP